MDAPHTQFEFTDWTHGALSGDTNNPLSDVSIANSSFSVDMLKGCALQCAYCHVQWALRNLDDSWAMPRKANTLSRHTPADVLRALMLHPAYSSDAVISIGTSSTEPFVKDAIGNTLDIMRACLDLGMKNPLWIVTKAGVPDEAIEYVRAHASQQNIIISPTWGWVDKTIEPAQNDRFRWVRAVSEAGAKILLYLRPIVPEWGSDFGKITTILEQAKSKIGDGVNAIAPGGLRWTQWVEYGLAKRGIDWPASIPKVDNEKELSEDYWDHIFQECARLFPGVPVVRNSSCWLSHILGRPDIGAKHYLKPHTCASSSCSAVQRDLCQRQREILGDPQHHSRLNRHLYAVTGQEGFPVNSDPDAVLRWALSLPYDQGTTAIKMLWKFKPHA